jgi:hypothetical protein
LYVALPALIIYGLGIPAYVIIMLRKYKENLNTLSTKQKFGFLYNGYKPSSYYWEAIIMYRKTMLIFIAIVLNGFGVIV